MSKANSVPNPLERYREKHRLTRKRLAEILGVSVQLVGHIERGVRGISAENAIKWEDLLGEDRSFFRPDLFLRNKNAPARKRELT
ncbi:helix-turn-helix domain-containing protein [Burkholderia pseudomallei]|uniref:helix-turn-helix domain-containing protein n=1 Tax=Burkholderia pseudomallei TaxID=28450 RepID=UPI0009B1BBC0